MREVCNLYTIMEKYPMTVAELSEKTGITTRRIEILLYSYTKPTNKEAALIAAALEVTVQAIWPNL
jgi:lambda repressor-like predicted transcriptional regulator